jgi:lysine biosynthesis protein LysW
MDVGTKKAVASCPSCGWMVNPGARPREGQEVTCPNCGAYLEVINLEPLEFDWAFTEIETDWDPDEEMWDEDEWDEDAQDEDAQDENDWD